MKIDFLMPGRRAGRPLTPRLIDEGVGGTEEAYINMSRELARLGWRTTVYADCREDGAGTYDGVVWRDLAAMDRRPPADVVVASDMPLLQERSLTQDSVVYFWMHVHHDLAEVMGAAANWNKLIVLSAYSRRAYAGVPDERIFQTRNGIDLGYFHQSTTPRVPFRLVYGSDYDRGLSFLLRLWPQIRSACPEATLRVFYGWEMFDWKMAQMRETGSPFLESWERLRREIVDGLAQDGVTHLGRIGHRQVAEEFLAADIWAYPCTFPETSCITAMKAQAGGAIPVVFPTTALRETVRFGIRTAFDPLEREDLAPLLGPAWFDGLRSLLNDRAKQEEMRAAMTADARTHFDWSTIAREWSDEFAATIRSRPAGGRLND